MLALGAWAVVPVADHWVFADINVGVLYIFAVSSLGVYGIIMGGWASNSKYAFLGSLRSAAQMVSYEVSIGFVVITVILLSGTMNLQQIVVKQNAGSIFGWDGLGNPYILTQFIGFLVFMIAVQAELTQTPFDMPIAESELVSGYMTEYSGFRFLIFFIAEFATAGVFALIASVLFLGGWGVPFSWFGWDGNDLGTVSNWMNIVGPLLMVTKMMVLVFFIMWIRFSYPRFREDQLQRFAWKALIPIALGNIMLTAILKVVF
jgi:NADH-quinone oxidoreductase subunit H